MADTTNGPEPGGVEDDPGQGGQGSTYHGEGVGRREQVDSGPATGTPGHPHAPNVHVGGGPVEPQADDEAHEAGGAAPTVGP